LVWTKKKKKRMIYDINDNDKKPNLKLQNKKHKDKVAQPGLCVLIVFLYDGIFTS